MDNSIKKISAAIHKNKSKGISLSEKTIKSLIKKGAILKQTNQDKWLATQGIFSETLDLTKIKKFEKGFKSTNSEGEKLEIKYKYSTNYYLSELDENKFIVDIEGLEFNFSTSQIINFINN